METGVDDMASQPGRAAVTASLLLPLVYILWFFPMFALGYWVTDLFDAYPTTADAPELTSLGLGGILAAALYGLVAGWPSWTGAALAWVGLRRGAARWGYLSLVLNLVMGLGLLVSALLPST
jgi:hypothetical protein